MFIGIFELLVIALLVIVLGTIYWYASVPKNLPPGPPGIPLLGNAYAYRRGANQHLIVHEHLKQYGPIFKLYMANKLVVVLGDYECIHEALVKQGDTFAGRPPPLVVVPDQLLNHGVIFSEGDLWKEHRRFALSTLRDFGFGRPIMETKIKEEIEHLSEHFSTFATNGVPFNPQTLLTSSVSNITAQLVFGKRFQYDDEEHTRLMMLIAKRAAGSDVGFLTPFTFSESLAKISTLFPQVQEFRRDGELFMEFAGRQMHETMKTYDAESEPTNYIHAYMKYARENPSSTFTELQLHTMANDLLIAGSETSATALRYALLLLAHHPEIQDRMYREIRDRIGTSFLPDYSDRTKLPFCEATIMETQRMLDFTPLGVPRRTLAETKLMGYDIPKGTVVIPFLSNVMKNEQVFPEAERFNPMRFLDENMKVVRDPRLMPFQIGKRMCLGESLARMELFIFLVGMIGRYRFYFPTDRPEPSLKSTVGITSAPQAFEICIEARPIESACTVVVQDLADVRRG